MSEKVKIELEFSVKASPSMLYQFLSTPSGLAGWFCDDVNSRGEIFTFFWDDSEEAAKLLKKKTDKYIQFQWVTDEDDDDQYYFEFRIQVDELTQDVSLVVTDFVDEDEKDEAIMLWESQINELLHTIGS